jgi:hypothetical protein
MAMGYSLVRTLARWVSGFFYRRIDLVGLENIPESGPLIVAANHQNALVDPMLLQAPDPALMPLRTGAARMLLEAEAAAGGNCGVALVPLVSSSTSPERSAHGVRYSQPAVAP